MSGFFFINHLPTDVILIRYDLGSCTDLTFLLKEFKHSQIDEMKHANIYEQLSSFKVYTKLRLEILIGQDIISKPCKSLY